MANSDFYARKVALAPMVKAGRTPLRILTLDYGADIVYTEEIIDQKLLQAKREVNDILGTIDYTLEDEVVLRVAKPEREKIVLQMGTNSVERAVEVCKKFAQDVAAIDVNMGCPKPFSISGGMGAALLKEPDKVKEILTSLVAVSSIPISCKIRVLDSFEDTLKFVHMIEKTGISAFAVHGRRRDERPQHSNRLDEIREIVRAVNIPVLANGNSGQILKYSDIENFRAETGASGVLIARKGLSNPSIFRKEGLFTMQEEIENFLDKACEYDENYTATKYVVQRILGSEQEFDPRGRATVAAANVVEICRAWNKEDKYEESRQYRLRHRRKREMDHINGISFYDLTFPQKKLRNYATSATPKCALLTYCIESRILKPVYECRKRETDGRFEGLVEVDGKKFSSRVSQPNKKMAEQVAALVALIGLNQRHRLNGEWEEES